jgi:hypothetical protein
VSKSVDLRADLRECLIDFINTSSTETFCKNSIKKKLEILMDLPASHSFKREIG